MDAERILVGLVALLAGADVVLLFVALNAWSDRNRMARQLQEIGRRAGEGGT